jgi:hypothetical protein
MGYKKTCHLSSLLISEDEDVIVLPMKYGNMKEGNGITYLTNNSCEPLALSIVAKYDGYGAIIHKENEIDTLFTEQINSSLKNNKEQHQSNQNPMLMYNNYFVIAKEANSDRNIRYRHYNDESLSEILLNEDNIPSLNGFDSVENLIKIISSEELLKVDSSLNRIGLIFIKKSIYNSLIKGFYKKKYAEIRRNVTALVDTHKSNVEKFNLYRTDYDYITASLKEKKVMRELERKIELSPHSIQDACFFFNDCEHLSLQIKIMIKSGLKNNLNLKKLINTITTTAILMCVYRDNGKSLYPNTNRYSDMQPVMALSNVISNEIDNIIEVGTKEALDDFDMSYLNKKEQKEVIRDIENNKWSMD